MKMIEPEGKEFSWLTKLLIKVASADEATLRICPRHDVEHVKATAWLLIGQMLYQSAIFTMASARLFGHGRILIQLTIMSVALALFIMFIDSYSVVATQWHVEGLAEIARGGLTLESTGLRIKNYIYLSFRIALSAGLAQLTAIFLSLLIFSVGIAAYIQNTYLQANAHPIAVATRLVDDDIQRAKDAVTAQAERVGTLSTQLAAVRQHEIGSVNDPQLQQAQDEVSQLLAQKAKADEEQRASETYAADELAGIKGSARNSGQAGNGPKRRAAMEEAANAKTHALAIDNALDAARARLDELRKQLATASEAAKQQSVGQLPEFESALDTENGKLSDLRDRLAALTQGRNDAIRTAVEKAPDHVDLDDGFLAQLIALEHIAQSDPKIATLIILIDLTSFGFELAAVLCKVTTFSPTTYSALIARDAYLRCIHIADEIVRELDICTRKVDNEAGLQQRNKPPAHDLDLNNPSGEAEPETPDDPEPQPPKRPRGRPRKS